MGNDWDNMKPSKDFEGGWDVEKGSTISQLQQKLRSYNIPWVKVFFGGLIVIGVIVALAIVGFIVIDGFFGGDDNNDNKDQPWLYGVMVDMGSSGTRVSIYAWKAGHKEPVQPAPPASGNYWYMAQRPGLSSQANTPENAGTSIAPLLDYARDSLTSANVDISTVPIFFKGTAGLRLLPPEQSKAILDNVADYVTDNYDFIFQPTWIQIISGQDEAVYGWVSVQQVLLLNNALSPTGTTGVIDMGGASLEVSFVPASKGPISSYPLDMYAEVPFNGDDYSLYSYSYLGYGHDQARFSVEHAIINANPEEFELASPCLLVGCNQTVIYNEKEYTLYGSGDAAACQGLIQGLMNKDNCPPAYKNQCAFNDVYQPAITSKEVFLGLDNMARVDRFYELSERPVLKEFLTASETFCGTNWELAQVEYANRTEEGFQLRDYCFEGLYTYTLLTWGLGFQENSSQVMFTDPLYNVTISWTLGAMVYEVSELDYY